MEKIGLFYGSDTGNTETVALKIRDKISKENVFIIDMYDASVDDFAKYDKIILGLSTWHDGQLQSDWDTFFEEFKEVDFTGKTVALFGWVISMCTVIILWMVLVLLVRLC